MHGELQGTRIRRSSRATPPQTDSDYNKHLQLKLRDVHRGWEERREKDQQTKEETHREMRDKPDECGSESESEKRKRWTETGENRRWPEMA